MEENEKLDTTEEVDYIETIKQLKNNSVSKADYQKLKDENQKLLKSIINGETIDSAAIEKPDIIELRKELYSGDNQFNNLEYITKVLTLRDAIMEAGQPDPFLPFGEKTVPTNEDIEAATRVGDILKECIEYAEGDSIVFTNELQRRMVDTSRKR